MGPVQLSLTSEERAELTDLSLHSPKPYLRERAAGLLKIADGQSGRQVAAHGLLRRRRTHTVYGWVRAFKEKGLAGLSIKQGRGRKPAFSPPLPGCGPR